MKEIEIGKTGLILEGVKKGWYVYIQDDCNDTGGFLILKFSSLDPDNKIGFDDWVETFEDLQAYFQESSWKIKWLKEEPKLS